MNTAGFEHQHGCVTVSGETDKVVSPEETFFGVAPVPLENTTLRRNRHMNSSCCVCGKPATNVAFHILRVEVHKWDDAQQVGELVWSKENADIGGEFYCDECSDHVPC